MGRICWIIPHLCPICTFVGMLIIHITARMNCKAQLWTVPFSSTAASTWPESTILGFFLAMAQIFGSVSIYTIWHYLHRLCPSRWNDMALLSYIISCTAIVLIATCPINIAQVSVDKSNLFVHNTAGAFSISFGVFYSVLMTKFVTKNCSCQKKSFSIKDRCRKCKIQMAHAIFSVAALVSYIVSYSIRTHTLEEYGRLKLYNMTGTSVADWTNDDGSCKNVLQFVPEDIKIMQAIAGVLQIILILAISAGPSVFSDYFQKACCMDSPKNNILKDSESISLHNNENSTSPWIHHETATRNI